MTHTSNSAGASVVLYLAAALAITSAGAAVTAEDPPESVKLAADEKASTQPATGAGSDEAAPARKPQSQCAILAGEDVSWDDLAANAANAVQACTVEVAAAPTPRAHYLLGRAYDAGGDFDGAVKNYRIAAEGGDLAALDSLCESLVDDGRSDARKWCAAAAEAGVDSAAERLRTLE